MNRSNIGKLPAPADKVYMALRSFATKFDLSTIEPEANISKSLECFIEHDLCIWNNLGNSKITPTGNKFFSKKRPRSNIYHIMA